jgi:hypothetical protein
MVGLAEDACESEPPAVAMCTVGREQPHDGCIRCVGTHACTGLARPGAAVDHPVVVLEGGRSVSEGLGASLNAGDRFFAFVVLRVSGRSRPWLPGVPRSGRRRVVPRRRGRRAPSLRTFPATWPRKDRARDLRPCARRTLCVRRTGGTLGRPRRPRHCDAALDPRRHPDRCSRHPARAAAQQRHRGPGSAHLTPRRPPITKENRMLPIVPPLFPLVVEARWPPDSALNDEDLASHGWRGRSPRQTGQRLQLPIAPGPYCQPDKGLSTSGTFARPTV